MTASGRGCALSGSPPGGRRGEGAATAHLLRRDESLAPEPLQAPRPPTEGRCACGAGPAKPHIKPQAPCQPGTDGAVRCGALRCAALRGSMRLWLGFGLLLSAELSAVSAAVSMPGTALPSCGMGCSRG